MAVIRALASANGKVLSRAELLGHLPRGADGHAVEMAVTRLRDAVRLRSCVETVIKRGYRLNLEVWGVRGRASLCTMREPELPPAI
nr:hypothetical protein GCM10025732_19390 [Glycomyces mayteni]